MSFLSVKGVQTVVEPKFMCPITVRPKKAKCWSLKGKGLLQRPSKKKGQLMLKKAKLPYGFGGKVFIGKI